jgi:lysophospholipid acyltransferase (LPLAT)-like uncharacterized protein
MKIHLVNRDIPDGLTEKGINVIYAFWHSSVFLLPYAHRDSGIVIMVSESKDGEIAAGMLDYFGFEVARGSSKRKGSQALIGLIKSMRNNRSIAIAVDGPRGPRHTAKNGAVFLAGRLQAPIIPVATASKHYWTLEKTWEKLVIPVPFTEGVVQYGQPIMVNSTSRDEIASKCRELEIALCELMQEAAERELPLLAASKASMRCRSEKA